MSYLIFAWCGLALVVISMACYRKMVAGHEDDYVHLGDGDAGLVDHQKSLADRLTWIDKWGKGLTVLTVVLGVILCSLYLYQGWLSSTQLDR